uniref:Cyclin n=1 Tax=Erythrolobus madagascarensis TaxID=708628 RepID=A0A7S0T842_9RHOD
MESSSSVYNNGRNGSGAGGNELRLHADMESLCAALASVLQVRLEQSRVYSESSNNTKSHAQQQQQQQQQQLPSNTNRRLTCFDASSLPAISACDYFHRVAKYAFCSPACLMMAFIYIERGASYQPSLRLSPTNVHRLIITAVMLAAKFFDDVYYNNAYYAKVGGIPLQEINLLETEFLMAVGFELFVSEEEFIRFETDVVDEVLSDRTSLCADARRLLSQNGFRLSIRSLARAVPQTPSFAISIPATPAVPAMTNRMDDHLYDIRTDEVSAMSVSLDYDGRGRLYS